MNWVVFFGLNNAFGDIVFSSNEWDFGAIGPEIPIEKELHILNRNEQVLEIQAISTCDCLSVEPEKLSIAAGEEGQFKLSYDPSGDGGKVEKYFIFRTNRKALEKIPLAVHGEVKQKRNETEEGTVLPLSYRECLPCEEKARATMESSDSREIYVFYFYSPGCRQCERFLDRTIPELEEELSLDINVMKQDILDPEVYQKFKEKASNLGEKERAFPALVVGSVILQGSREIENSIESVLREYVDSSRFTGAKREKAAEGTKQQIAFFSASLAGLVDGSNPCAFTTIICLLTALTLAGRLKREILLMGILFTLSVFVTYLLLGLGFFRAIRVASSFPVASVVLRWLLVSVLVVFAGLSFYDYSLIRSGRSTKIILKLPSHFRRQIQAIVKSHVRTTAIVGSSVLLGFLVSLFELGCTGQVYFPFIVYAVRIERQTLGYLLLLVYNLCFVLPLVVIFVVAYLGISSRRLTELFQKNMGKVKIALALLFVGLAALTILT
jgi:cytochrome c biogenesis protein CcdA